MSEARIAALEAQVAALADRIGIAEDIQAIRTLQFAYGYFMDKCMFAEIVDLFADDAELHFMGGVFRGKAGARRLYGGASKMRRTRARLLFEHVMAQDIVHVAPDRKTAEGRFRTSCRAACTDRRRAPRPRSRPSSWKPVSTRIAMCARTGVWKFSPVQLSRRLPMRLRRGLGRHARRAADGERASQALPGNPAGPDRAGGPARALAQGGGDAVPLPATGDGRTGPDAGVRSRFGGAGLPIIRQDPRPKRIIVSF